MYKAGVRSDTSFTRDPSSDGASWLPSLEGRDYGMCMLKMTLPWACHQESSGLQVHNSKKGSKVTTSLRRVFHIKCAIMPCSESEWCDLLSISSLFSGAMLFPRLQLFILEFSVEEGDYFIWTATGTSFSCSLGDLDYKDKMLKTFLHLKH